MTAPQRYAALTRRSWNGNVHSAALLPLPLRSSALKHTDISGCQSRSQWVPFVGRWTLSAACVTVGTSREARRLPLACMAKSAETRPRNAWAVAWTREPKGDSSRMRSYGLQRPLRCGPAPRSLSLWGAFFLPQHTIYVGQLLVIFVATRSGGGAIAAEWYGIQHCPRGNAEFQPAYRLCRLYRPSFVGWAKLSGGCNARGFRKRPALHPSPHPQV